MTTAAGERGTATLWVLGVCIALMFLAGLSLDLWRAIAVRRELSSMADAAATAGANGVDESALRAGTVQLDPSRARALAVAMITHQIDAERIDVSDHEVTVTLRKHVEFSLLSIFMGGEHFDIEVRAAAYPEERS